MVDRAAAGLVPEQGGAIGAMTDNVIEGEVMGTGEIGEEEEEEGDGEAEEEGTVVAMVVVVEGARTTQGQHQQQLQKDLPIRRHP